jgi:hypothetical protein
MKPCGAGGGIAVGTAGLLPLIIRFRDTGIPKYYFM